MNDEELDDALYQQAKAFLAALTSSGAVHFGAVVNKGAEPQPPLTLRENIQREWPW